MAKKLFKIHADQQKNNSVMNLYYVYAKSKTDAKQLFKKSLAGLPILSIDPCGINEEKQILNTPTKHRIIQ